MNLAEAIELYVQFKRANGVGFEKGHKDFLSFKRSLGSVSLGEIKASGVTRYLNGPKTSTTTFRSKHNRLRHFFEFCISRGFMQPFSMPANRPPERQTFTPYIFTKDEVKRLLRATQKRMTSRDSVHPQTLRTLVLTLYATGALVSEIASLDARDVDLRSGFITIRTMRFNRQRRLPIGTDLVGVLRRYASWKERAMLPSQFFFPNIQGTQIVARTLISIFKRLRKRAGVARYDGATYQPRMHDLRATFAVHRIASWIKRKADLNRMLPALSVYMGQVGLTSTERYLFLTPERFRRDLDRLSPTKFRLHWRDDPALIGFLSSL